MKVIYNFAAHRLYFVVKIMSSQLLNLAPEHQERERERKHMEQKSTLALDKKILEDLTLKNIDHK